MYGLIFIGFGALIITVGIIAYKGEKKKGIYQPVDRS